MMRDTVTLGDFLDDFETWRTHLIAVTETEGETMFKMLQSGWPELAFDVEGTENDPRYDRVNQIDVFLGWLSDRL